MSQAIILASGSRYRAELLARLGVPFSCCGTDIDESAQAGELPGALAARLALAKACSLAGAAPVAALIIGSDQVATCAGTVLGKPGSVAEACEQLRLCSGRCVVFHTALSLLDNASSRATEALDITRVRFRTLSEPEIIRYVAQDQPLDCAGSFKVEAAGITLFEQVESTDSTALIGMPLIALCRMLRAEGVCLP